MSKRKDRILEQLVAALRNISFHDCRSEYRMTAIFTNREAVEIARKLIGHGVTIKRRERRE